MNRKAAKVVTKGIQGLVLSVLLFSFVLPDVQTASFSAQAAPLLESAYPPSPVITGITFDAKTHREAAPGSDNWPVTWAANGNQYTSWGDGGGFGGSNQDGRVSLGFARVEGDANSYQGLNVWGGARTEVQAQFGGKSYGVLAVGDVLYMWVSPGSSNENYKEARLAVSHDYGQSWEKAGWAFTQAERLVLPTFVQFGRGYSGAADQYVYIYAIRLQNGSDLVVQKPGMIDLLRVPTDRLLDRQAYEFFSGISGNGEPSWTPDIAARQPVFRDPNGVGWTVSGTYNAGLGRYLLVTEHGQSSAGNLGIFDAPTPWGPWTTVLYTQRWLGLGSTFFWNFSNKWTSADGLDFTLVFTGTGDNDSWNTMRGRFNLVGISSIPADMPYKIYLPEVIRGKTRTRTRR